MTKAIGRRALLGSASALAGAAFLGGVKTEAHPDDAQSSASTMADAANRFLAALTPEQRLKAVFKFEDDERMNWHFIPKDRKGLPFREMAPYQKHLASALLSAGLSRRGHVKAVTIMSLEEVLRIVERDNGELRNPEKYYFSIFGTPSTTGTWGYRVEGHHLSQNYTAVDGTVIDAPSFFGANPAEVRRGARSGLRTLAREDDLGLELIQSLEEPLRKIAIVDSKAYRDILTSASRKAALEGQPSGLVAAKMSSKQFDILMALIEEYARNVPGELAKAREEQIAGVGRDIHFAWAGGIHSSDPRYYRVQTPSFLIEFDDTQNGANHIHSVWRDLTGDFGADLLKQHYETSHPAR